MTTRVLTGITTSGTPHLGNYAGAIRPAIQASLQTDVEALFFLADYHALVKCDDPQRVARSRLELAATWLAAGLNPEKVTFYRQSDIPEIPELCWMLGCVTAKGLMNRAHAYKAAVDQNVAKAVEPDDGITMGLFSYPVLMAADILAFGAHKVPVGRDQIQHLEMARDIAQRFNHLYGDGLLTLPQAQVDEEVATLPGLDGRKMSKSYDNTIPLFAGGEGALHDAVKRIVTDSRQPGEPKDADTSHIFLLYRAFATPTQTRAFRAALEDGLGWGDAKAQLLARIQEEISPMRERYTQLMAQPARIEDILQEGAAKARKIATPLVQRLREAVGIHTITSAAATAKAAAPHNPGKKPRLVNFRDTDGSFRLRLVGADGKDLFLSEPFADARQVGMAQKALMTGAFDSESTGNADVSIRMQEAILGIVRAALWPAFQHALRDLT